MKDLLWYEFVSLIWRSAINSSTDRLGYGLFHEPACGCVGGADGGCAWYRYLCMWYMAYETSRAQSNKCEIAPKNHARKHPAFIFFGGKRKSCCFFTQPCVHAMFQNMTPVPTAICGTEEEGGECASVIPIPKGPGSEFFKPRDVCARSDFFRYFLRTRGVCDQRGRESTSGS